MATEVAVKEDTTVIVPYPFDGSITFMGSAALIVALGLLQGVLVQDNGTPITGPGDVGGEFDTLNFIGATLTPDGNVIDIEITGGSGGWSRPFAVMGA